MDFIKPVRLFPNILREGNILLDLSRNIWRQGSCVTNAENFIMEPMYRWVRPFKINLIIKSKILVQQKWVSPSEYTHYENVTNVTSVPSSILWSIGWKLFLNWNSDFSLEDIRFILIGLDHLFVWPAMEFRLTWVSCNSRRWLWFFSIDTAGDLRLWQEGPHGHGLHPSASAKKLRSS